MRRLALFVVVVLLGAACGDSAAAADPERFCEISAELEQYFDVITDVEEARERGGETIDLLDEAVRVAPDEIRSSVEIISDGIMQLLDIYEAADFDEAQIDPAELDALFEDEAVPTASDAMEDWVDANCST